MKNKPKYKKTPFAEWKADKPDWQTQLIGHKILYGCKDIIYFAEFDVLDYESTNNVFYTSENGEKAVWRCLQEIYITHILEEIEYDAEKKDTKTSDSQKDLWERLKELSKLGEKTSPPETIPYIPPYNPPPRPWKNPIIPQPDYPPPNYPGPYWEWNKPWCQYYPNENWSQS